MSGIETCVPGAHTFVAMLTSEGEKRSEWPTARDVSFVITETVLRFEHMWNYLCKFAMYHKRQEKRKKQSKVTFQRIFWKAVLVVKLCGLCQKIKAHFSVIELGRSSLGETVFRIFCNNVC